MLFPIQKELLPLFDSKDFNSVSKSSDSDYLYSVEKLAYLKGRLLSKKRNLIKQFEENFVISSRQLNPDDIDLVTHLLEKWKLASDDPSQEKDSQNCKEAVLLVQTLNLDGKIYFIENEVVGVVIGEWITTFIYDIHFEKALKSYKGLYQYLLKDSAQSLGQVDKWINLEQDLGFPALRQFKHSYQPDALIQKMRIYLNHL